VNINRRFFTGVASCVCCLAPWGSSASSRRHHLYLTPTTLTTRDLRKRQLSVKTQLFRVLWHLQRRRTRLQRTQPMVEKTQSLPRKRYQVLPEMQLSQPALRHLRGAQSMSTYKMPLRRVRRHLSRSPEAKRKRQSLASVGRQLLQTPLLLYFSQS